LLGIFAPFTHGTCHVAMRTKLTHTPITHTHIHTTHTLTLTHTHTRREGERISMTHVIGSRAVGESLSLEVLRNGRELRAQIQLCVPQVLVSTRRAGKGPSFLVIGGLVLTPLTVPYLEQVRGTNKS
jgi:hypothetical protein